MYDGKVNSSRPQSHICEALGLFPTQSMDIYLSPCFDTSGAKVFDILCVKIANVRLKNVRIYKLWQLCSHWRFFSKHMGSYTGGQGMSYTWEMINCQVKKPCLEERIFIFSPWALSLQFKQGLWNPNTSWAKASCHLRYMPSIRSLPF